MAKQRMGFCMLTALVVGSMVGSGIFMVPTSLARIGSISLLAWIFTAIGAIFIALVFAKMSFIFPKNGGPYAFARESFGDFIGFQTAYIYWISLWIGNAGIAIATIGYLKVFFPALADPNLTTITALAIVWFMTLVNIISVRSMGIVQIVTTVLKFVPLVLVIGIGFWYFHPEYITTGFNVSGKSNFAAFSYAATITMWAFLGIEAASIPAATVANPTKTIPMATMFGTIFTAIIYIASAIAIMGLLPAHVLAESSSPFALAIELVCGKLGLYIVAAGAVIACIGTLNGLVLCQAQIPMAAADDNLFPSVFSKRNAKGIPVVGSVITSLLISVLLIITSKANLVDQFQMLILIAAATNLVAYLYTAAAEMVVYAKNPQFKANTLNTLIAFLAVIYSFWTIFGSGLETVFYMTILIFSSFPIYFFVSRKQNHRN